MPKVPSNFVGLLFCSLVPTWAGLIELLDLPVRVQLNGLRAGWNGGLGPLPAWPPDLNRSGLGGRGHDRSCRVLRPIPAAAMQFAGRAELVPEPESNDRPDSLRVFGWA